MNNEHSQTEPELTIHERSSMLVPVAYNEASMPSLRLARSSRLTRRIAKWLFFFLVITIGIMTVAPWQQSVSGTGNVLAYSPNQREQVIEAPTKGRISRWGENIYENAKVKKGDFIAEISDLDDSYQKRLQQQLVNAQMNVKNGKQQLAAAEKVKDATYKIVESLRRQVKVYQTVKDVTESAQNAYVEMAKKKILAENQKLEIANAAIPQLKAEIDRLKILLDEENIALQKYQEVDRKYQEAQGKVKVATANISIAKSDLEGKTNDRISKIEKAQVDVDYAKATLDKAIGDISKAESDVAKANQELNKAEKAVLEMEVKVSRQNNQTITAPFDGYLVQITPNQGTAVIKEHDPICRIVPITTDRAVQIWLDGNDAPLVEAGRHVRLQFEGWPAVQFAGWPSVAVGTFGGVVASVDATDNGKGKFRVLILPDTESEVWPEERFLKQGVQAKAWVLLDQVQMWFEVWRKLNGFPPVVDMKEPGAKLVKPPKLPK